MEKQILFFAGNIIADLAVRQTIEHKLTCFIGVKTTNALAVLTEFCNFKRFATAQHFTSYLVVTPGEDFSRDEQIGFKSKVLKE